MRKSFKLTYRHTQYKTGQCKCENVSIGFFAALTIYRKERPINDIDNQTYFTNVSMNKHFHVVRAIV